MKTLLNIRTTAAFAVVGALSAAMLAPLPAAASMAPASGPTHYGSVSETAAVSPTSVFAGESAETMSLVDPLSPEPLGGGKPYIGTMTVEPNTITNYDLFASGVSVTAHGLPANQRALITDTSPDGSVYTFDPVTTDDSGSLTTKVRRADRYDPQVGIHRLEATTSDGSQAGTIIDVTLSERLNASGKATPDQLTAIEYHDAPVVAEGSGFLPFEGISATIRMPGEDLGLLTLNLKADAEGKVRYSVQASTAAAAPGRWAVIFGGDQSNRNGFAEFFVNPAPQTREVGTITPASDTITREKFANPGMSFEATDLAPFGLYDLELKDPNNRWTGIGRYRANGDGKLSDGVYGTNVLPGRYELRLTNADTTDFAYATFALQAADGSIPVAPSITVDPSTLDAATLMGSGITASGTGWQPGERVRLIVRDKWSEMIAPGVDIAAAGQADEKGQVSLTFKPRDVPADGTYNVTIGEPYSQGLLQTTSFTVGNAPTPSNPDPSQPGTEPEEPSTQPAPTTPTDPSAPNDPTSPGLSTLLGTGARSYFVRLNGEGALGLDTSSGRTRWGSKANSAADDRIAEVKSQTQEVLEASTQIDKDSRRLYETVWTTPGIALHMTPQAAAELETRPDVVSVTPIVTKSLVEPVSVSSSADGIAANPTNTTNDKLTGAVQTWKNAGYTGKDTTIAIIDTGVDYTHADFGGPGGDGSDWVRAGTEFAGAMPPTDSGLYDPDVILPGWDFAGERYNADPTSPSYSPNPVPDSNPVDGPGGGHGTHVAGTAAGRGVKADGATFDGDYKSITDDELSSMKVGPGSAPAAKIMPLKVFGDEGGSTDLAGAALDWVAGQIATGTKIDVVNMSLGSSYTPVDDPENAMVDALTAKGVVVVISAGNSGDVTDVAGSPGNAESSLAVAASSSGFSRFDVVQTTTAVNGSTRFTSQFSQDRPQDVIDVTAPVVAIPGQNATGCAPFTNSEKSTVTGKIVWLEWDEAALARGEQCGSAARFVNAAAAGATGVLLTSTLDQFESGIAGSADVFGAQLTRSSVATLRPALDNGSLVVRLATENAAQVDTIDPTQADTVASFTSRGVHGSVDDIIKPDLSAPGVNVVSAGRGSGTGSEMMSGTSMSAPHTSGIAALLREARRDWSAQRIKNVLMNTAVAPVLTRPNGVPVSPLRGGVGRIDASHAVNSEVTVSSKENGALISASFGVVEVGQDPVTQSRTLVLTNSSEQPVSYNVGIADRTSTPGATFSLDRTSVTVPANGTAEVSVTLSIPSSEALRRTVDPDTAQTTDTHPSDLSGIIMFTPVNPDGETLGLTVFAAPRPVSDLSGTDVTFDSAQQDEAQLAVGGRLVAQGEGDGRYDSRVTPLVAGPSSPKKEVGDESLSKASLGGADILRTGISSSSPRASTPSQGMLTVGVEAAGPMVALGMTTLPMAMIDANRDGRDDFAIVAQLNNVGIVEANTIDVGTQKLLDTQPLNGLTGPTGQFDNDTAVLRTTLAKLGYTDTTKATTIEYRVQTVSQYAPVVNAQGAYDSTDRASFDVYAPPVSFGTADGTAPVNPTTIPVYRGALGEGEILLFSHDNATGHRVSPVQWKTSGPAVASGISVTKMPDRVQFGVGEKFDAAGLVVSVNYSDGTKRDLDAGQYSLSTVDTSTPGARTVDVTAVVDGASYSTAFDITVVSTAQPPVVQPQPTTPPVPSEPHANGPQTPLAKTGVDPSWIVLSVLGGMLVLGGVVFIMRRKRSTGHV